MDQTFKFSLCYQNRFLSVFVPNNLSWEKLGVTFKSPELEFLSRNNRGLFPQQTLQNHWNVEKRTETTDAKMGTNVRCTLFLLDNKRSDVLDKIR